MEEDAFEEANENGEFEFRELGPGRFEVSTNKSGRRTPVVLLPSPLTVSVFQAAAP